MEYNLLFDQIVPDKMYIDYFIRHVTEKQRRARSYHQFREEKPCRCDLIFNVKESVQMDSVHNKYDIASCCICSEEFDPSLDIITLFGCDHFVHEDCFQELKKKMQNAKCPLCKIPLSTCNTCNDKKIITRMITTNKRILSFFNDFIN